MFFHSKTWLRVTNSSDVAEYSYLANSKLFGTVTFRRSGTTRMTTTRKYDLLNRLTEISSAPSGTNSFYPLTHAYRYNDANQRTRVSQADGSYWVYQYDALGQVKSGKKYWADGTPVAGQQFEYSYDDIGNRTQTKSGGDSQGQGLRTANYTANNLNQYTGRDVPGVLGILGIAHGLSSVTVDGTAAYRKGEYFHGLVGSDNTNSTAGVYPSISTIATLSGTSQTNTGNLFLPKTPEGFSYDFDGNMTGDGRWIYSWDGENRLKSLESYSGAPTASKRKLEFEYDHQGRRIQKIVSTHNGSSWVAQSTNRFVHDGWNLLAEFTVASGANSLTRVYVWGTDLSGSMQGAGGVGGLLMVRQVSGTSGTHFAAYDGNGNVTGLVNASNGNVTANYEYDPFGQTIRATGDMALLNPFRFSTKYTDGESGFLYYGYRYYDPNTGRWVNRDPLTDESFRKRITPIMDLGKALINKESLAPTYVFTKNSPTTIYDLLGLIGGGGVGGPPMIWKPAKCKPCKLDPKFDYNDSWVLDLNYEGYSPVAFAEALSEELNRRPVPNGVIPDLYKHCAAVCLIFVFHDPFSAFGAAVLSELPWIREGHNSFEDFLANLHGFFAPFSPQNCLKTCHCRIQLWFMQ
jgi:RHS repeat-associated protein